MKTESLKGSVHDRNKRSRRKYGSKDTGTVGRTDEEADCMAVTNLDSDSTFGYATDKASPLPT
jgi:hypothetical protein